MHRKPVDAVAIQKHSIYFPDRNEAEEQNSIQNKPRGNAWGDKPSLWSQPRLFRFFPLGVLVPAAGCSAFALDPLPPGWKFTLEGEAGKWEILETNEQKKMETERERAREREREKSKEEAWEWVIPPAHPTIRDPKSTGVRIYTSYMGKPWWRNQGSPPAAPKPPTISQVSRGPREQARQLSVRPRQSPLRVGYTPTPAR